MTRARRHGFYFDRHELAGLGIVENSKCWGLWVEGRNFDQNSRLDTDQKVLTNESPQLGISAIHPVFWPTAFNLEVLIARRPIDDPVHPTRCDAFLGLADALARCGVNVLLIRTAQVGYDLISVTATCELPRLRGAAQQLVELADKAGQEMDQLRGKVQGLSPSRRDAELDAKDIDVYRRRAAAFQALGLLIIPQLADLETRLLAMEYFRDCHAHGSDLEQRALTESSMSSDLSTDSVDAKFAAITGREPKAGISAHERQRALETALESPWFFRNKVAAAGENTYFLSYYSITGREAMRRAWPERVPHVAPTGVPEELSERVVRGLYEHVYEASRSRDLSESYKKIVPESPARTPEGVVVRLPRSATAERMMGFENAAELEHDAYRDFFRRQALLPVKISALPSLAHMRFWAFGGAAGDGRLVELRYRDHLLRPDQDGPDGSMRLKGVFDFLNRATNCGPDDPQGVFGPHMAVLANISIRDRFARLRFCRERVEPKQYLSVRLQYTTNAVAAAQGPNSQGLLRTVSELVVREGFRVEWVSTTLTEIDDSIEQGVLEVVGRTASSRARELCARLGAPAGPDNIRPRAREVRKWIDAISGPDGLCRHVTVQDLALSSGFVKWDR